MPRQQQNTETPKSSIFPHKAGYARALLLEKQLIKSAVPTKKHLSHFPWKELARMRNRLIHAYFDVDHDTIWMTVRNYVPGLCKDLEDAIAQLEIMALLGKFSPSH